MNVFVLCTGRCGSVTFAEACSHITNFSSGHETRWGKIGQQRLAYPGRHIEADNRLSWLLGRLDEAYGNNAYYVHLHRDAEAVARSFGNRWENVGAIAPAYRDSILVASHNDRVEASRDMVETISANIRSFMRHKDNTMEFALENAETDFQRFWHWIGAEGDLSAALAEWRKVNNPSRPTGKLQLLKLRARKMYRVAFPRT